MTLLLKRVGQAGASNSRITGVIIISAFVILSALLAARTPAPESFQPRVSGTAQPDGTPCESVTFTGSFTNGQPASTATRQAWANFITSLNPSHYAMVTISGSNDPIGRSLFDRTVVPQIATAMQNGGTFVYLDPSGLNWNVGQCGNSVELNSSGAGPGSCGCENPGYTVRPQVTDPSVLWGGVNSFTCPPEGNQTMTVTFSAACCATVPSGLVSWWPADGNSNDVVSHNNGTLENGAGFGTGEVRQAFSLNGSNQDLSLGNPASLKITPSITIDAWINPNSVVPSDLRAVLSKWGQSGLLDNYAVWLENNGSGGNRVKAQFVVSGTGGPFYRSLAGGSVPVNTWTHVAVTYDGDTGSGILYVNGTQVNSFSATAHPLQTTDAPVYIGSEAGDGTGRYFPGLIDEVEVFNRALTSGEINAISGAGHAGKCHPCTTPPSGMLDWWPGDGNARDVQGGKNGQLKNGATFGTGEVAQAFSFNSSMNQYVDVGSVDLPSTFTIDAWINPSSTSGIQQIVSNLDFNTGGHGYSLYLFGAALEAKVFNGSGDTDYVAGAAITAGTWQHVTLTYDGNTGSGQKLKFYVNGVLRSANPFGDSGGSPGHSNNSAKIGTVGDLSGNYFNGLIDELELFGRVLTAGEIQSLYDAGSVGKCKPPQPTAAFSRKVHGGAGTFDIDLMPFSTAGVECRSGGASGTYQMIVQFASPVTVTSANLIGGSGSVSGFSVSGATVTVNLMNITNAHTVVMKLGGVSDGILSGDVPVAMSVLIGDTSGNGAVSATDVTQTKLQSGQGVTASNFREDVIVGGTINGTDVSAVKLRTGTAVP
jgi:concanavalin A-like lectin/glucanase superfamily protein